MLKDSKLREKLVNQLGAAQRRGQLVQEERRKLELRECEALAEISTWQNAISLFDREDERECAALAEEARRNAEIEPPL